MTGPELLLARMDDLRERLDRGTAHLAGRIDQVRADLARVEAQAIKTNGRVTALEKLERYAAGARAASSRMVGWVAGVAGGCAVTLFTLWVGGVLG